MPDVQLLINGDSYSGWTGVHVRRSIDYLADMFDLTLTDTAAGAARSIRIGSPCQILIDGEKLITGHVDCVRPSYNARTRAITVSGRSKTADLVDCSLAARALDSVQRRDQTLLQLATWIAGRFGIKVRSTVDNLNRIAIATYQEEETPFEFLEALSRKEGARLMTDPEGNLVITRSLGERIGTALVLGENVLSADADFKDRDRYSHYYVSGQRGSTEDDEAGAYAHITGLAEDRGVRYRPTAMCGTFGGLFEAQRYAEWMRNVHFGRSRQATYTVAGWRHADGIWSPNTSVLVRDPWTGFEGPDGKGEWLMIGTVELILDEHGQRTQLTVMPSEAYDLVPLPEGDDDDDQL